VVAVWGPCGRQWLVSQGFDGGRIVEVGHPTVPPPAAGEPTTRRRGPLRVLYASSPPSFFRLQEDLWASQETLWTVYKACEAAGCQLVAKPHPNEAHPSWGEWVRDGSIEYQTVTDSPVLKLLRDADVFVSDNSTAVLDAISARVPVILLELGDGADAGPYDGFDLLLRARGREDLTDILRSGELPRRLDLDESRRTLDRLAGPLDGRAGTRLADALLSRSSV
jgi:hypothetical protein